jgi:hypothetical protein
MDLNLLPQLEGGIRDAVQLRTRYLCHFDDDGGKLLYGKVLNVGLDHCIFRLRPVGGPDSGRHALIVTTQHSRPKVFRETKQQWFQIDHVADYAVEIIGEEAERRGEQSRARQRITSARNSITRLSSRSTDDHLPPMDIEPSDNKPGLLDVKFRGLTEVQVEKVLVTLHMDRNPKSTTKVLWDHLHGDEDLA